MADISDVKIFIPTKNRLDNPKTYNILKEIGLNPILVIEPQEEEIAKTKNLHYMLLPENEKGLIYSRNYILNYCRKNNIEYAIMIDDDINYFGKVDFNNKKVIKNNGAFLEAIQFFIKVKTCGSMEYNQFAWASTKTYSLNRGIEVVHFLYLPVIPKTIQYEIELKEDKDFAIQLLMSGVTTFRLNSVCISVPSIGTNKGGLYDLYQQKRDNQGAINLYNKWGKDIIQLKHKKDGRIDCSIKWNNIQKILKGTI